MNGDSLVAEIKCDIHHIPFDDEGRCPECAQESWITDDRRAKKDAPAQDDVAPFRGPEC